MAGKLVVQRSRLLGLGTLLSLMILTLIVLLDESVLAATYYVSKSTANGWSIGNDSNTCTATNAPCLSIAGGLDKMSSGDMLIINDGTYVESLDDLVPSGGGTEATRTVVKCFKALACTLDASYLAWNFVNSDTNWITIQDMVICCGPTVLVRFGTTSGVPTTNYPHHIRIQGNDIHTSSLYCVYTGHGQFNEFINNKIHKCNEQGVYALFRDSVFRGNQVYDVGINSTKGPNYTQGMQMGISSGMLPSNNLIEANLFRGSPKSCLEVYGGTGHTIRRNLFYTCGIGFASIAGTGDIDNSSIDHNVFYGNATGLLISDAYSTGNLIRNNIALSNSVNISICAGCGTQTTNRTIGTPTDIWVSPSTGDFRLKAGSAAIDSCTNIGLPFYGSAPDCGAYESGGSSDTTPPRQVTGVAVR